MNSKNFKEKQGIQIITDIGHKGVLLSYKLKNWTMLTASFSNGRWVVFATFKYPKYYKDNNKDEYRDHHIEEIEMEYPPEKWSVIEVYKQLKKKFDNKILSARIAYYENIISKIKNTKITEAEMAGVKCEVCGSFDLEMIGDPEYREDWECKNCKNTLPF